METTPPNVTTPITPITTTHPQSPIDPHVAAALIQKALGSAILSGPALAQAVKPPPPPPPPSALSAPNPTAPDSPHDTPLARAAHQAAASGDRRDLTTYLLLRSQSNAT